MSASLPRTFEIGQRFIVSLAECLERSVNLNWKYAFVILQINSLVWAEVSRTPEQTGGEGEGSAFRIRTSDSTLSGFSLNTQEVLSPDRPNCPL